MGLYYRQSSFTRQRTNWSKQIFGSYRKKAKHTSASFKYTNISMNIDTVLSFPRRDREEDPRQFINEIKMAILEVREHSPDLPTWLYPAI